jgi:hypothetical protein
VATTIAALPEARTCTCGDALATALVTDRALVPVETQRRLAPLLAVKDGEVYPATRA